MNGLAFCASLFSVGRGGPFHLQLFSLLLGISFIVECAAFALTNYRLTNAPLYNIYILLEFSICSMFYYLILENKILKQICLWSLVLFPLFWVAVVFGIFGIANWNSYLIVVEYFFIVCMSSCFYYQLFTKADLVKLSTSTEFWIATGLIIFCGVNMPYMGMLNYLTKNHRPLAGQLMYLLKISNFIMYSLFIYAFLCRTNTKR